MFFEDVCVFKISSPVPSKFNSYSRNEALEKKVLKENVFFSACLRYKFCHKILNLMEESVVNSVFCQHI